LDFKRGAQRNSTALSFFIDSQIFRAATQSLRSDLNPSHLMNAAAALITPPLLPQGALQPRTFLIFDLLWGFCAMTPINFDENAGHELNFATTCDGDAAILRTKHDAEFMVRIWRSEFSKRD
jgi:hypothetical protein